MGKLYCLMGKSASGKDTIFRKLLQRNEPKLRPVIPYTTRPPRQGEQEGVDYHFCSAEQAMDMQKSGRVIEMRTYQTVHGPWSYFTADDGQIDLQNGDYLLIGTPEVFEKLTAWFGREHVAAVFLHVDDGIRLERALSRERMQEQPRYAELCRRYLADEEDFSEERLKAAGITGSFENRDPDQVTDEICRFIRSGAAIYAPESGGGE